MSSIEPPKEALQKHLDRQGRMTQWITLEAFNWLRDSQKRQAANEEAENKWFRKTLGDEGVMRSEEDMGTTILGDITHPAPIIMPPAPQSNIGTLLGLLATMAAAGMGGYMFANRGTRPPAVEQQPPPSFDDSTLQIGLGRLEDYQ